MMMQNAWYAAQIFSYLSIFKNTTQHLSLENMFWLCQHLPLVLFKDVNRIGIVHKCNEQRLIITNKENKKADYNVA